MYLAPGQLFDHRAAGVVIPMRVADQQNLDVVELEPELFDTGANHWNIRFQIAVDEDVTLWRRDEIVREAFAADVVQIAGDVKWRIRLRP